MRSHAYKPLLARAVADAVPAHLLRRTGKGDFSPDAHEGLARHRRRLADLTEHSALAHAGLIDAALLCRLHGSWPTWRTGVRLAPFRAHAWIEADGAPVGEPAELAHFRPVITVAPVGRGATDPGPSRSRR